MSGRSQPDERLLLRKMRRALSRSNDHPQNIPLLCAEGNPNPNLLHTLGYRMGEHAIESNHRQQHVSPSLPLGERMIADASSAIRK
jgi:hypothetical protein